MLCPSPSLHAPGSDAASPRCLSPWLPREHQNQCPRGRSPKIKSNVCEGGRRGWKPDTPYILGKCFLRQCLPLNRRANKIQSQIHLRSRDSVLSSLRPNIILIYIKTLVYKKIDPKKVNGIWQNIASSGNDPLVYGFPWNTTWHSQTGGKAGVRVEGFLVTLAESASFLTLLGHDPRVRPPVLLSPFPMVERCFMYAIYSSVSTD